MQSPRTTKTALLVIDLQLGANLPPPGTPPPTRSTPNLEANISKLLSATRSYNASLPAPPPPSSSSTSTSTSTPSHTISIIHVHHHSRIPTSDLHPTYLISGTNDATLDGHPGVEPLPCATPADDEPILIKSVNSSFIGTPLETMLRDLRVRQLIVTGMTTEHCVSTTVRMAGNLNVTGDVDGFGERGVVLVEDGCACFGKVDKAGKEVFAGEVVHRVEVECLRDEFCRVVVTADVLEVLR